MTHSARMIQSETSTMLFDVCISSRTLHTICIVHYEVYMYDARVTRTLSDRGVILSHEFRAPWDDPFYPGKCHCQGKLD